VYLLYFAVQFFSVFRLLFLHQMTVNFYLAGVPTKRNEYTIRMYITAVPKGNRKPITISVGRRVQRKYWDAHKQRVKPNYTGSPELNRYLESLRSAIERKYDAMCADLGADKVQESNFKPEVLRLFIPPDEAPLKDFLSVFDEFIEHQRSKSAANTIKKYQTVRRYLAEFQEKQRFDLRFENITATFSDTFSAYLRHDVGLINNSISKVFSLLKTFLHWATGRSYNTNTSFTSFKIKYEEVDTVALTREELMRLAAFDFTHTPTLEKVRDVFCFQCFTGQRFSDVAALHFADIKIEHGQAFWYLRTRKTKDALKVPLNMFAMQIVEKYRVSGSLPIISAQKTNQYVKEACKLAGITEPVLRVMYKGSERIEKRMSKYEAIATHTARRTFVTVSLQQGMRPETLMKITGHANFKTLQKYIRLTDNVVAQEMTSVWGQE
jgi:site-specific recombinase XerD